MTNYLDDPPKKRFKPKGDLISVQKDEEVVEFNNALWNSFGHKAVSKDFSSDMTPQDREDNGII